LPISVKWPSMNFSSSYVQHFSMSIIRYVLWHAINYRGIIFLPPPHSFEQGERPTIFQANFLLFFLFVAFDFGWSPAITVVGGCFISSFRPPSCARGGSRSRRVGDESLRRSDLEDREQRGCTNEDKSRGSTPRDSRAAQSRKSIGGIRADEAPHEKPTSRCNSEMSQRLNEDKSKN